MKRGLLLALAACGSSPATTHDAPSEDAPVLAIDAPGTVGTYRDSLSVCWTDATCQRVLAVAHGGAWDASGPPYDSNGALVAAFTGGDDGVKIDVRVTKDNVPVIAHSSPIQVYESTDCANQKIEEMTAAQVTACHRFPSTTETFQRLDDVLTYLHGKMTVQLCVKLTSDFQRTIDEVHAQHAEDIAYLEINAGDVPAVVGPLTGSTSVWWLVNVASDLTQIDPLLAMNQPKLFMVEIDPTVAVGTLPATKLHPAGVRAFTYDDTASPTVAQLKAHYDAGYDAVSSQSGPNGVEARVEANTAHGVTPP
jgi:hypothetical protein